MKVKKDRLGEIKEERDWLVKRNEFLENEINYLVEKLNSKPMWIEWVLRILLVGSILCLIITA